MVFSTTKKIFCLKSFKKSWANKKKFMDSTFVYDCPPPSFFLIEIMIPFSYHVGGEGGLSDAFFRKKIVIPFSYQFRREGGVAWHLFQRNCDPSFLSI